ncbi:NrtR DNA-binding winged helix domain-containing protein [Pseudosulfitobacter pseudonitzschiae]|uniref:NrtR DNA-binding winged helix domain-containing protein n=1 Tax=Pseudosulfitobacter pseudonitzschiae TaxID=1402135 RepID=UPI003B79AF79
MLENWAGIGRSSDLPEDVYHETFFPFEKAMEMITPHQAGILNSARNHLQKIAGYSKLPAMLLDREFTLPEMRIAYEVVSGFSLQDAAFRRKVASQNIILEVGERRGLQTRPAKTYQLIGVRLDFDRNLVFSDTRP